MAPVRIRRVVTALALLVGVGFLSAAPASAQEEGEHDPVHDVEAEVIANGGTEFDAHCVAILAEGGSVDDCQKAPNQLVPETNELIWGAFGFVVVFGFLFWKGVPAIKKTMSDRTERIRGDLESAEGAKTEASRVLEEYRAQLADAKSEAGRIIEEARQQGEAVRREQEARLQTELATMRERAAADVESAKAQAIADLRGEVASLAIGAAEVVVGRNLDRDTQTQLVEQYIASVGNRN